MAKKNTKVKIKVNDQECELTTEEMEKIAKGLKDGSLKIPPLPEVKKDQPNLFGESDFLINTIHKERILLSEEITRTVKAIERKKDDLQDLVERKDSLKKAANIAKKSAILSEGIDEKNPIDKQKIPCEYCKKLFYPEDLTVDDSKIAKLICEICSVKKKHAETNS